MASGQHAEQDPLNHLPLTHDDFVNFPKHLRYERALFPNHLVYHVNIAVHGNLSLNL